MYARMTTFYLHVKSMEHATKVYQESIIPAAKNQPGFLRAFFLTNSNAGKFVAITIWDNIEHALANQKSGYYQAQIDKFNDFMIDKPDVEGFSVGAMSF
ncbi:MAG: antibiotic biosynthesis monooxygenase [Ignavibacteriae bacterium]|nr:antibiotic biosynthesis monooxygenase [Ignavibacteriota bacterium]